MGYRVAVVGATGAVGREMLQTLAERNFPADTIYALASTKSVGKEVSYGDDQILKIERLINLIFQPPISRYFRLAATRPKPLRQKPPRLDAWSLIIHQHSAWMTMCR